MKHHVYCYECEHEGDMDNYCDDLKESGARVLSTNINYEAETGEMEIEVEDFDTFIKKFKETDSEGFCTISGGY